MPSLALIVSFNFNQMSTRSGLTLDKVWWQRGSDPSWPPTSFRRRSLVSCCFRKLLLSKVTAFESPIFCFFHETASSRSCPWLCGPAAMASDQRVTLGAGAYIMPQEGFSDDEALVLTWLSNLFLESHRFCDRVQDAYTLRCCPQVCRIPSFSDIFHYCV